jgi:acyl-CoA dehydrogenase
MHATLPVTTLHQAMDWPFFEARHRALREALHTWGAQHLRQVTHDDAQVDATCVGLVRTLGRDGWLGHAVGGTAFGGVQDQIETRSICLIREGLAWYHGLADFAFAMQGLGSGAISLFGSPEQQAQVLPQVVKGTAVAAFALSETDAGSDVAGMQCQARSMGDHYLIDGEKTWISNGGIADFYVVFARTIAPGETAAAALRGTQGISAFIVDARSPGLEVAERIEVVAPHPLARLRFRGVKVPVAQRLGQEGAGFKIAMSTLDVFRTSVAAAALGFAQRALDEALQWARQRRMFGQTLADFQITQSTLADMATELDAARLLTYRAAWLRDQGQRITCEAAMAKMAATESAQRIIDAAVQMHGGMGVRKGTVVESLYREIRALRIYEGATEVQRLIIAREMLKP